MKNDKITAIYGYMRLFALDLGERILERCPALHQFSDPVFTASSYAAANTAPSSVGRHHEDCETLANRTYGVSSGGVWRGKDPDFARGDARVE